MRALFASLAMVSALSMATAALAAPLSMIGTVKSYDATAKTLVLTNGDTFVIPSTFKDPGIKAGEKVNVLYNKMGDKMEVDSITIEK